MKTERILMLDYREEETKEIIQKVLRKIKPLSKYSEECDIPLEAIEKLIFVLAQKYAITPQWLMMSFHDGVTSVYSVGVKTTTDHKWIGTIHGMCLYEVFAKLAIKMYSEVKQGNIELKAATKEEKQRERLAKKIEEEESE